MSFPANYGLSSIFNVRISQNSSFLKKIELPVENDYESHRNAVGYLIEPIPFLHDHHAVMVGNEEAKLIGMEGNRRFIEGIVAGSFFICGDDGEDFCSLTDEQFEKYVQLFSQPHEISQDEVEQDMRITLIGF